MRLAMVASLPMDSRRLPLARPPFELGPGSLQESDLGLPLELGQALPLESESGPQESIVQG
jgi:hypothetical protein